jgi:hypothetical protein
VIVSFVGGKDFDQKAVAAVIQEIPRGATVACGHGLGLEKWVAEHASEFGLDVRRVDPNEEMFGKKAKDCEVSDLVSLALYGTLYLVGNGTRVKIAKQILKRAPFPIDVREVA